MQSRKQKPKTVLFDLGGTLVKTSEIPFVLKTILEQRGISRSLEEITEAWKQAEKGLDHRDLAEFLDEFWVRWNMRILSNLKVVGDTRALSEYIATHWWNYSTVTLYPDAEKVLPQLKQRGLKIGLISNGLLSDVNSILLKVNLQGFFDIEVVIDTLRRMKPDPEIFHYAMRELTTTPTETVFIGDEIEADYKGARSAGLTAYLIDRNCKVQDRSISRISSLHDLFELNII